MKYSITIEGETKAELWDTIYVFPNYDEWKSTIDFLTSYCNYDSKTITNIRPWWQWRLEWNGALRFEFMCWTDAYYSDEIRFWFIEWSYNRFYYKKEDAEKEKQQRIDNFTKRFKEMVESKSIKK